MTRTYIPQPILDLAHARAAARGAQNWAEADRLKSEIEVGGWRVVDSGTDFRLEPAAAPLVEIDGTVRYGRSDLVPSRLGDPPTAAATVILDGTGHPEDLKRALAALAGTSPAGTQIVVISDGPSPEGYLSSLRERGQRAVDLDVEFVQTSGPLAPGVAQNMGIRRAIGSALIVMDVRMEPDGDIVSPLVQALDDPGVAAVGAEGLHSDNLRRFDDAPPGDVAAVTEALVAFRRVDVLERGPLDEGFRSLRHLIMWWSLVLRDAGVGEQPRRAIVLGNLAVRQHARAGEATALTAEENRLAKRSLYRLNDWFGPRPDLGVQAAKPGPAAAVLQERNVEA